MLLVTLCASHCQASSFANSVATLLLVDYLCPFVTGRFGESGVGAVSFDWVSYHCHPLVLAAATHVTLLMSGVLVIDLNLAVHGRTKRPDSVLLDTALAKSFAFSRLLISTCLNWVMELVFLVCCPQ